MKGEHEAKISFPNWDKTQHLFKEICFHNYTIQSTLKRREQWTCTLLTRLKSRRAEPYLDLEDTTSDHQQ